MESEQKAVPTEGDLARWKRQGGRDDEKCSVYHAANYWHVSVDLVRAGIAQGAIRAAPDEKGNYWIRRSEFSRVKHWKLRQIKL